MRERQRRRRAPLRAPGELDSLEHRSRGRVHTSRETAADGLLRLQSLAGNRAVQRAVVDVIARKPKVEGQEDKEEAAKAKLLREALLPLRIQRVTTTFDLTEPAPKRSNTDASTTSAEDPTFVGSVTKNDKKRRWGYKLDSVEAKGKIQIVYFTEDRYPAPTPTDDSGALTNVTEGNWKDIIKDFKANRKGIPDFWSAYLAENLHENYHWKGEWQKLARAGIKKAEKKIGALKLSFDDAAAEDDAKKDLEAKATTIFDDEMTKARTKWNAMGDSPGDPPYRAQAPAIDALGERVKKHAKEQKWD
jgi:hypothetical protein